jgi:hypothetical protein
MKLLVAQFLAVPWYLISLSIPSSNIYVFPECEKPNFNTHGKQQSKL